MTDLINKSPVERQVNIGSNKGDIYFDKPTRIALLFKKLKEEAESQSGFTESLQELQRYVTDQDGLGLEKKLSDGGYSSREIDKAEERKQLFWMKAEKGILYPSARKIYALLLAKVIVDFEAYIEPLIFSKQPKEIVRVALTERIIDPIFDLLNNEAGDDEVMLLNTEEIFGMIYYLTGRCHLNWTDYDTVSSGI